MPPAATPPPTCPLLQVSDPEKLKNMSKKQLRMIKKTRVTDRGTIEFVSPYSK